MTAPDDARYERERGFHDHKYAEDAPASRTEKYYIVLRECYRLYTSAIERDCAGKEILEYGCGKGSHAFELARRGARVTGIDISPVAIEESLREADAEDVDGVRFLEMNAEHLELDDASFDRICGASILHHLDLDVACAEIARCLRPDGDAVFVEPLGHNPAINLYRRRTPELRTADEHPLRRRDFSTFERHFGAVDLQYFGLTALGAFPFHRRGVFDRMLRGLERFDAGLFRVAPSLGWLAWFSVVRLAAPRIGRSA